VIRWKIPSQVLCVLVIPLVCINLETISTSVLVVLACCFLCGLASAIGIFSCFAWVALFPSQYMTAVMSGSGLGGIIIVVIRVITKVSLPGDDQTSAVIYFAISGFTMLLCIVGYLMALKLPFVRFHLDQHQKHMDSQDEERERLLGRDELNTVKKYEPTKIAKFWTVLRKIWLDGWNEFYVFFLTLALFPGMMAEIPAYETSSSWFVVLIILIFQVGDFIGRTAPRWIVFPSRKYVWIPVLGRSVFFALFLLCISPVDKPLFRSDLFPYVFMGFFSVTNGYFGTIAMLYGPMAVEPHERETAGALMATFQQGGIFLGIQSAIVLLYALKGESALPHF